MCHAAKETQNGVGNSEVTILHFKEAHQFARYISLSGNGTSVVTAIR